MNLFAGTTANLSPPELAGRYDRVAEIVGADRSANTRRSDRGRIVTIDDGGAVLGRATSASKHLVMLGLLQRPLPEWTGGAPIDDPDMAARYLLDRFERMGERFLDGIDGQFALALDDRSTGRTILACDSGGHRSLFYRLDGGSVVFSTNLAILPVLAPEIERDRSLEDFLLGYEFLPWNRTPFRGVMRLGKGSMLSIAPGAASRTDIVARKAAPDFRPADDPDDVMRQLHDTFMTSLEKLLPTDEPVAVLLGGFDSALIAAGLARLGRRFETFTFRFQDSGYTQRHTDTLQTLLGHRHQWVDITPDVIEDGLRGYELCFNQPVGQMHYLIETAHACSIIRRSGYRHCLTGDGCDEVFLGYPTVHQRAVLFRRLGHLPDPLRRTGSLALSPRFVERQLGHVARLGRNVIDNLGRTMPVRGHITSRVFDSVSLDRLRRGQNPPQEKSVETVLTELAAGLEGLSSLRLAYHGKAAVGLNKAKVEGCSAASGVTLQSPYQYPDLANFAHGLPDEMMRPSEDTRAKATGKHILMRMAETQALLPPEIIYQTKASPVTAPVDGWYATSLRADLLASLGTLPFDADRNYVENMLRPKLAEELFRRHIGLGRYTSHAISLLATYAALFRHGSQKS